MRSRSGKEYSLRFNEKKEQEIVPPAEVRKQYYAALQEVFEAEDRMRELLREGGYIHE